MVSYRYYKNGLDSSLGSGNTYDKSWPIEMSSGEERNLLISAREDDTEVTVSIERLPLMNIRGEEGASFYLNAGEAKLIAWYPTSSGSYQINANANYGVRYLSGDMLDNMTGSGQSLNYTSTWIQKQYSPYYLYIEASSNNTTVTFTATKEIRPISVGSSYSVKLNYGESEKFTFTAPQDGTYIFYSTGSSIVKGDVSSNNRSADVYSNGADNNFCISRYLVAGEQVEITVTKQSDDVYDDIYLYAYMLHNQTAAEINKDTRFNENINLEANQEEWFLFTVEESGWYEFSIDSSA